MTVSWAMCVCGHTFSHHDCDEHFPGCCMAGCECMQFTQVEPTTPRSAETKTDPMKGEGT